MKKILLFTTCIIIAVIGKSQVQKADLQASGLTCSMCSKAVNNALKDLPFVQSVTTDLNTNIFTVTFKPGTKPDFDMLNMKVEGAGFSVASLWAYASFKQVKIKNDEHIELGGLNFHFMNVKEQLLNGEKKMQLLDKNFVSAKNYKKSASYTTMDCYKTGFMSACCEHEKASAISKQRIYHVTI